MGHVQEKASMVPAWGTAQREVSQVIRLVQVVRGFNCQDRVGPKSRGIRESRNISEQSGSLASESSP